MNNPKIDFAQIEKAIDQLVKSSGNLENTPNEVRSTLEPFIGMALIDADLLEKYFDALVDSRKRNHFHLGGRKADGENNSPSIEAIIRNGLPSLDDNTFRILALKPIALRLLSDALNDKISDGSEEIGDVWWHQLQQLELEGEPKKVVVVKGELQLDKERVAVPANLILNQQPLSLYRYAAMAMALAAAVLVGVGIGIYFFGGTTGQGREILAANAGIEKASPRGNGIALELKVSSKRSGFLSFIVISQGRPQVLPEYGEELLTIAPNVPVSYGPVDASGTLILCIITETPSTEVLRKLASKGELSSKNPEVLKSVISEALWKANFKWIEFLSMSIPNPK